MSEPSWARRLGVVLLVALASATCIGLGVWQWNRHTARVEHVERIEANLGADAVPLADLLPPGSSELDESVIWRPVTVTGVFIGNGVELRNRPESGANAAHALGVLMTDETPARLLVVDRGWWRPAETDSDDAAALAVDAGTVTLTVRLRAAEDLDSRTAPEGSVFRLDPASVLEQAGAGATGADDVLVSTAYGMLAAPAPSGGLTLLPDPDTSLRSHLSYTFQWWFFAAAIPVAAVVIHRRNRADDASDHPGAGVPAPPRPAQRRRTLEEEEDAILDAAQQGTSAPGRRPQASDTRSA